MAPERYSFEGMRVVRSYTPSGVDTLAVEVHHVPGQGTMFDVRSSDGRPGPASFIADSEASADGLEGKPLGPLVAAYDLALDGSQTVDGRPSTVISASQDGQVCARFWAGRRRHRPVAAPGDVRRRAAGPVERVHVHQHRAPRVHDASAAWRCRRCRRRRCRAPSPPPLNDKGWTCVRSG